MTRKHFMLAAILPVAVVLISIIPAYSASNHCRVSMPFAAEMNGTHIAAGQYNISWQASNPSLTVTVAKGQSVVATVQGKMEDRSNKFQTNMVVYKAKPDGSQIVSEIRLGGTSQAIVFSE
jgi:hypothetical protein